MTDDILYLQVTLSPDEEAALDRGLMIGFTGSIERFNGRLMIGSPVIYGTIKPGEKWEGISCTRADDDNKYKVGEVCSISNIFLTDPPQQFVDIRKAPLPAFRGRTGIITGKTTP